MHFPLWNRRGLLAPLALLLAAVAPAVAGDPSAAGRVRISDAGQVKQVSFKAHHLPAATGYAYQTPNPAWGGEEAYGSPYPGWTKVKHHGDPERGYTSFTYTPAPCTGPLSCKAQNEEFKFYTKNRIQSQLLGAHLRCSLLFLKPLTYWDAGGTYDNIAVDPGYHDPRDTQYFAAQGYGVPVSVPLAPVVRNSYEYGWGVPSSRLVPK